MLKLFLRAIVLVAVPVAVAVPFVMTWGAVNEFGRGGPAFWACVGLAVVMVPGAAVLAWYVSRLWNLFED